MARITIWIKGASDPERALQEKAIDAAGYRHHLRRKNGKTEIVVDARGVRSRNAIRTEVKSHRYLGTG